MILDFNFCEEQLTHLWRDYQNKRNHGLKKEANKLLNEFVHKIKDREDSIRISFVKHILGKIYDDNIDFDLQYPLLKHIIFPILVEGFKNKNMPEIRWLYQIPYIDEDCALQLDKLVDTDDALLVLALEIDGDDMMSQKLLLKYYISALEFGTHEIPLGLLFSIEEGYELTRKVDNLIKKYTFEDNLIGDIKKVNHLHKELLLHWKNFRNQNVINDFDSWCEKVDFNYIYCRSMIWKLTWTYF